MLKYSEKYSSEYKNKNAYCHSKGVKKNIIFF